MQENKNGARDNFYCKWLWHMRFPQINCSLLMTAILMSLGTELVNHFNVWCRWCISLSLSFNCFQSGGHQELQQIWCRCASRDYFVLLPVGLPNGGLSTPWSCLMLLNHHFFNLFKCFYRPGIRLAPPRAVLPVSAWDVSAAPSHGWCIRLDIR